MTKKPVAKKAPVKKAAKSFAADYPRDYENGRRAARSGIPKEQAPAFFNGDQGKAWLEGYESRNG